MDGANTAVVGGEVEQTTQTESAPVEQTAEVNQSSNTESSEKTQTPSEAKGGTEEQAIPYSRFKEVNDRYKSLSSELETYKSKAELLDKLQSDPELARTVLQNFAPEAVKPIDPGLQKAMETLKEHGFMSREDFEKEMQAREQRSLQKQTETQVVNSFMRQVDELSKKYDGKNGLPAFDAEAVASLMDSRAQVWKDNGEPDVEAAYFLLNREAIIDAQAKQVRSTAFTERDSVTSATPDNPKGLIAEAQKTGNFSNVFQQLLKR